MAARRIPDVGDREILRKTAKRKGHLLDSAESVLEELKRLGSKRVRDGLARFGIPAEKAVGVSVGTLQKLAKRVGRNHELAVALWATDCYEARMMASFVDEPSRVTAAQMDRWCRDFDNWAICDTVCFHLFDRTPHAWNKIKPWSGRRDEFVKRAGFVLMACLAGHDKSASDTQFLALLPIIEQGAQDERNFVKKGVSWALRMIGRRNLKLYAAAMATAGRLAKSKNATCQWVGRDALRDLAGPKVRSKMARRTK